MQKFHFLCISSLSVARLVHSILSALLSSEVIIFILKQLKLVIRFAVRFVSRRLFVQWSEVGGELFPHISRPILTLKFVFDYTPSCTSWAQITLHIWRIAVSQYVGQKMWSSVAYFKADCSRLKMWTLCCILCMHTCVHCSHPWWKLLSFLTFMMTGTY